MYINHGCKSKHIISNEWAIVIPLILDDLIVYFKNGSYFPRVAQGHPGIPGMPGRCPKMSRDARKMLEMP